MKVEEAKVRNGYWCNNAFFGRDPRPNWFKQCFCDNSGKPFVQGIEHQTKTVQTCKGDVFYVRKSGNNREALGLIDAMKFGYKKKDGSKGYTCNNAFFGDPTVGHVKQCWCDGNKAVKEPAFVQAVEHKTTAKQFCNGRVIYARQKNEKGETLDLASSLRYGYAKIAPRKAAQGYFCSNAGAGRDPVPGHVKQCWCDADNELRRILNSQNEK